MKKSVAIVHYNTPELAEAAILSLRKHCVEQYQVYVFDNSDTKPFTKKMKGVKVFDNTKGKYVDFEAELAKYPNMEKKMGELSNQGSVKHMLSVQKLWELVPDGFILLESDVLISKNIDFLWDENFAACGKVQYLQRVGRKEKDRLAPFLCYLNVPLLKANGARYYDPLRCWNLHQGRNNPANYWDTGACVLDDIRRTKPQLVCRCYPDLDKCYFHFHGGSWRNDEATKQKWLNEHKGLWYTPDNKNAKIVICAHTDFKQAVSNEVYEVMNIHDDIENGVPGHFYSELLHMKRVGARKKLPEYIGFCHYRKYFNFLNNVPDIAATIEQSGAIAAEPVNLGMTMHEQYGTWGNVDDLDITTKIINKKYKDFAAAWNESLNKKTMHPATMFVLKREDFLDLLKIMWDVANEYLKKIGGNIEKRVKQNPNSYHLNGFTFKHECRVGGQIAERIASAWIDWKFPKAATFPMVITQEKVE